MGSVFRKTTTRPIPAGATVTQQSNGRLIARWKTRKAKWTTAPVITTDDGRQVIRQESGTFYAKYRDHDGTVVVASTGCRDESTARQVLADLERQADRVRAGVVTSQELAVADQMSDPIDRHITDYVSTLTGSASHRQHTETYLRRLAADCRWECLADLRRDDLELWLVDQSQWLPNQSRRKRSARSRNGHHVAVVAFANWCVKSKRM